MNTLPPWIWPILCLILIPIIYAVWVVWRVPIGIWLIGSDEIRQAANNLILAHGEDAGEIAGRRSLEAWQHHKPIEAGRWDRVARWVHRHAQNERGRP